MALVFIENVAPDVYLGVWRIEETVAQFNISAFNPRLEHIISSFGSKDRQEETLAVHLLLYAMTGDNHLVISHTSSGKPLLRNYKISVSHTRGYAALILSKRTDVAVDIEYINERVNRITRRFMRNDEHAVTTEERLLNWCAKETMFKYFSEQNLKYSEICVHLSDINQAGCFNADNIKAGSVLKINYKINHDFVITYAF